MNERIEVGDVFTHCATGEKEYVAVRVCGDQIWFGCGKLDWAARSNCHLARKADLLATLQPDCKWVKEGWALHPTDFKMEDGKKVTAEYAGRSWDVLTEEDAAKHEWQRPRELDIDLLHTMKRIKTAANKLGEAEGQKFIWEMLQATAKAAKVLSEIRDRSEAAAKALQGGQP